MKIEQELQIQRFHSEEQKAQLNVLFTASWLKSRINQWLKDFDLTHEQFNVMRIIRGFKQRPICVRDISERMIDRSSNTTRILDKLEAKGLVYRTPSELDRREMEVHLTESGKSLLLTIDRKFVESGMRFSSLNETEAQLLSALLDKMREET
jgi:DNA-binding MarR family transcriptional regulator